MATKKRRKALTNYQKLKKNLSQLIRRAQKRGYYWEPEEILKAKSLSEKELKKLSKNKWAAFYKRGTYVVPGTDDVVTGTTGKTLEARAAARKAAATRLMRKTGISAPEYIKQGAGEVELDAGLHKVSELYAKMADIPSVVMHQGKTRNVTGRLEREIIKASNVMVGMLDRAISERGLAAVEATLSNEAVAKLIDEIVEFFMTYGLDADKTIGGFGRRMFELHNALFDRAISVEEAQYLGNAQSGMELYYGTPAED